MGKPIVLNPGAQEDFVQSDALYTAYIGGLGSGKSFGGIARGLRFSQQPKPPDAYHGSRGTIAAATYPHLRDTILPLTEAMVEGIGLANWSRDYKKSEKKLTLHNGATIIFRSLDDPDTVVRGPELSWVFIDEGRNVDMYSWKLVIGRLRQPGYQWGAWTASTPNGHDWMWRVFHPGSPERWEGAQWFNAPTAENPHLPPEYVAALTAAYEGRFYEQEVLGRFVGAIEGAVFPYWDPKEHIQDLEYRPGLPLYTGWDFGYGDTGVVVFAQVDWQQKEPDYPGQPGRQPKLPWLYILDAVDHKEWAAKDWARAYKGKLDERFSGRRTDGDYGDPAGKQRNPSTGTSVIRDLNVAGVPVSAVIKRPQDYAIRILNNMMAGGRVLVASDANPRVAEALSHHHWHIDRDGTKVGINPVHDWSSHFIDAIRYLATATLSFWPRDPDATEHQEYGPDTYGYVFGQLTRPDPNQYFKVLGKQSAKRRPTFAPRATGPR